MTNDENIHHVNITLTTWFFLILCGFAWFDVLTMNVIYFDARQLGERATPIKAMSAYNR
jgi:hypothetical protein